MAFVPANRSSIAKRGAASIFAGILLASVPPLAGAQAPRADTILSLATQQNIAVASTRTGMFRADTAVANAAAKWTPVSLPAGMEPGGCLFPGRAGSSEVYYTASGKGLDDRSAECSPGPGLWASADTGSTWFHVDSTHYFGYSLFAHPNGRLYAGALAGDSKQVDLQFSVSGGKPLTSSDHGKTWQPLTGTDMPRNIIMFYRCEEFPDHVCGASPGSMWFPVEYIPEQDKWIYKSPVGNLNHVDRKQFLGSYENSTTSECCYTLQATLANYFSDFSDGRLEKSGIALRAEKSIYHFHIDGPQKIEVSIELLPLDPPEEHVSLPEVDATQSSWGIRFIDAQGTGHIVQSQASDFKQYACELPKSHERHCIPKDKPIPGKVITHTLRPGSMYRRPLNLAKMDAFKHPGVYQASLVFDNERLVKNEPDDWTGSFTGAPFEIVIEP